MNHQRQGSENELAIYIAVAISLFLSLPLIDRHRWLLFLLLLGPPPHSLALLLHLASLCRLPYINRVKLKLILLKPGGRMMYYGPLCWNSSKVIEYFKSISGVPKIKNDYNPATWMLEVNSIFSKAELGVHFADIYHHSALNNKEQVAGLSKPSLGSNALDFPTSYSQTNWEKLTSGSTTGFTREVLHTT